MGIPAQTHRFPVCCCLSFVACLFLRSHKNKVWVFRTVNGSLLLVNGHCAVTSALGLCFSMLMPVARSLVCGTRTTLHSALPHCCDRSKSRDFGAVHKKLLGFFFMKDKWTSKIKRKRKTGLSFCAERNTRCKETQWCLPDSSCSLCHSTTADT